MEQPSACRGEKKRPRGAGPATAAGHHSDWLLNAPHSVRRRTSRTNLEPADTCVAFPT